MFLWMIITAINKIIGMTKNIIFNLFKIKQIICYNITINNFSSIFELWAKLYSIIYLVYMT